uniref:Fibronectin type-III domain-containing protein n=1 Tax=Oryzias latipes TaxID=8090 RepID=A0A3P9M6T1_ORYLA
MIAVFLFCLLSWCRSSAVATELPPPQDLTMVAINTNYTLRWNYKQSAALPYQVTFTTEFISKYMLTIKKKPPVWKPACKESPEHSCELTSFDLYYFSIYKLRVRASVNGNHSAWAFKEFCPDKDTGIGPPSSVKLTLAGYSLEVSIVDPLTSTNSSMKDYMADLSYNIRYWERHEDEEALIIKTISTNSNVVALSDLEPLTWYCVRVQSYTKYYNRSSSFTSPLCMKNDGHAPCWQILLIFMAFLVIVVPLVVLLAVGSFRCSRFWKSVFHPELPSFLIESRRDSTGGRSPQLITMSIESERLCDNMTVCPKSSELETLSLLKESAAPPLGLNPDSRVLRQSSNNSSSSTDSGVYSTAGTSGTLQLSGAPAVTAGVNSAVDFLPVKLKDIEAGLHTCFINADEGISES